MLRGAAPLRVVFAGTPPFAATALQSLLETPHLVKVAGVLTAPDRRVGRGRKKLVASAVKELAQRHELPVLQPPRLDQDALTNLAAWRPQLVVVAAYGLIFPRALLRTPPLGCINIHASLLPRWRGAAPIERCLLNGDVESGVTIMQMDEGCDTGDVLYSAPCPIRDGDTLGTLTPKLAHIGAGALQHVLEQLPALGGARPLVRVPQHDATSCYAHKVVKRHAQIPWSASAREIEQQVRAFNPRPVAFSHVLGAAPVYLRVWEARCLDPAVAVGHGVCTPGTIVASSADGVDVYTGHGVLRLLRVQPAGGRQILAHQCKDLRVGRRLSWLSPEE